MTSYASAAAPTKETPAAEDPLAAVGAKLQEGQERFDIADYEGAVEVWSEAYLSLAEVPDSAAYRSVLAYQIATACREAYKVGRDIKYLRRAERLLAQYVETLDPDEEEARASANEALTELRAQIEEAEAEDAAARETEAAALREQLAEEQRKAEERRKAEDDARRKGGEPDRARERKLGRTLQISGGVAVGVGAALLGVMGFGLARGRALDSEGETTKVMLGVNDPALEDIRDQGRTMNQLAWGAGISGGVLVAAGVSLLIVGSLQRARATAALPRLQVGRGLVGLSWSTRF